MKKKKYLTEPEKLRKKAEDLLKTQPLEKAAIRTETDALKLTHELSVHQIELEIQNKELIEAKETLELAVEKYTDLYDFAPTGYLTLSKEGQIIVLNLCASKMIGRDRKSLMKSLFGAYITDDTTQLYNNFLKEMFISKTEQSCEVSLIKTDNIPMYVYLIGVISKNGFRCEIIMIDITERKLAEEKAKIASRELEQLHQLNADKDLFISILAHDLRNPLSVLFGYVELLSKNIKQLTGTEVHNLVNEINKTTHITYDLLEDLLKWSTIRTGKVPFEPQKLSFTDLCIDIITSLSPIARSKDITISCNVADEIVVFADPDMLKAVFRNLVSNAIKFTYHGGEIRISAVRKDSSILFSVSDNGIGIQPDDLAKLFNISQFHTTPGTADERGTGLGLLLCRDFVEKHGGKIWAESIFGKGSVFYFEIPGKSGLKITHVISDPGEINNIYNLKVLIVDDNAALRMILGAMMQNYCREILYSETGDEAVRICSDNPDIDLILMDIYMPGMNGHEAIKQIRKINNKVIIIAETAKSLSEMTEDTSENEINDYFFKPYSRYFLNELIVKHFNSKKKGKTKK